MSALLIINKQKVILSTEHNVIWSVNWIRAPHTANEILNSIFNLDYFTKTQTKTNFLRQNKLSMTAYSRPLDLSLQ